MTLRESTLLAVNNIGDWANYIEVFNYMKANGMFLGKSKTPEKSVASELYRHAEKGAILKVKEGNELPKYKKI